MDIVVTYFKNCRDNNASNDVVMPWEEFRDSMLNEHYATEDKDTFMFNGIGFVNKREEAFTRRCADNAVWVTMAILDFDGGMTIAEAKEKFKDIEYAGYTSYSHKTAKKDFAECFRIVMPLAGPYPMAGFTERRTALKAWSGEVDESTTDRSRGFYLPSAPADMLDKAQCWFNTGKRLHMPDFAPEVIDTNNIAEPSAIEDDKLKATIKEKLMTVTLNNEPEWIKTMWAMKGAGFSEQDFIDVTVAGQLMRLKTVRDCQYRWKNTNGNTGNAGYLINMIRKKVDPTFLMKKQKEDNNNPFKKMANK